MSNAARCSIDYCYRITDIPVTYEKALTCPESHQWLTAMKDGINALEENNTNELTPLPKGRTVVGGKWVYAIKLGPDNTKKFKARYVAKGCSQVKDVDYEEFSHQPLITLQSGC